MSELLDTCLIPEIGHIDCYIHISLHENKKVVSPFYHKKYF